MIVEWMMSIGAGIADWFLSLFPDWTPPAEFTSLDDTINGFLAAFGDVGVWVPWGVVIGCAVTALGVWAIGLLIKAVRAIASYVPFFGGSG